MAACAPKTYQRTPSSPKQTEWLFSASARPDTRRAIEEGYFFPPSVPPSALADFGLHPFVVAPSTPLQS